jgi:hypothetical protein
MAADLATDPEEVAVEFRRLCANAEVIRNVALSRE